jgi:outer membrane protein assembly factor BamB
MGLGSGVTAATVASPDGSRLYVSGYSAGPSGERNNFVTIAYNPASGAQLWLASYNSGPGFDDYAQAMAVSPDGTKVFVTGTATVGTVATVAYNAATGAQLWVKRYFSTAVRAITVSPDSSKVFITGDDMNGNYLTTAYQASTGTRLWTATWAGPDGLTDAANAIGVTPDGSEVIVTGYNLTNDRGYEWLTVAYSASTGAQLWFNRFNAALGELEDMPTGLAVSPDGSFVAVTGWGRDTDTTGDMPTVAYDALTGAQLWLATYRDARSSDVINAGFAVAVSPDSHKVFVIGTDSLEPGHRSFETTAFDAATGTLLWATPYDGPPDGGGDNVGSSVAVSGDGSTVVVTGSSQGNWAVGYDFATLAYDTATGAQKWLTRHNPAYGSFDQSRQLAIVPGANRVAVAGTSQTQSFGASYFTTVMIAL